MGIAPGRESSSMRVTENTTGKTGILPRRVSYYDPRGSPRIMACACDSGYRIPEHDRNGQFARRARGERVTGDNQ